MFTRIEISVCASCDINLHHDSDSNADIDECLDGYCDHLGENSTCNNTIGYYECGCVAGYYKNYATYHCERELLMK